MIPWMRSNSGRYEDIFTSYNESAATKWMDDEFESASEEQREKKRREVERTRARDKARKAYDDYRNSRENS